ncbi:MAG: DUF2284 domain-containing protein [Saccharofermentanales bacterium]
MMEFSNELLTDIGISQYGIISTGQIEFLPEIRELCEKNSCRNFATTWACPPAVGTLSECKEKCLMYDHAMVFNSVYPLEDSFDLEGMEAGHRKFKIVCDKLYYLVKSHLDDFLLLSNESCIRCKDCTYPDSPCRFPEILFPSIEGFGILVVKLAEIAQISYINGKNTVTYFGMILY